LHDFSITDDEAAGHDGVGQHDARIGEYCFVGHHADFRWLIPESTKRSRTIKGAPGSGSANSARASMGKGAGMTGAKRDSRTASSASRSSTGTRLVRVM